jgi:putative transposase
VEMAKFKGKYRIESARLQGYDYSSEGSYFITICAHKMQHFFGHIENEKMHLNEIGKLAEKFWKEIPDHFPHAIIDEFIIMPNHMHGIIILNPKLMNVQTWHCDVSIPNTPNGNDTANTKETSHCDVSTKQQKMAAIRPKSGSLSVIIGSYKSVVSKHAHKISKKFEWLERFHDRIIRDENEFERIATYIRNNPKNWKDNEIFL